MRFFKLNAALLALIFSLIAELLFIFVIRVFGEFTEFGTPLNFISWLGFWFHALPEAYLPERLGDVLSIPAWLFQWWLMFFAGVFFIRYVFRKDNPKTLKLIIVIVTITLITSLSFLIHSLFWQNSNLKAEVGSLASIQGCEEADKDFQAGRLKVFVISGECHEDRFSGTNDGPFEVWITSYFPSLPQPHRYSTGKKIEAYNFRMRSKYNWSLTHTNNVKSTR